MRAHKILQINKWMKNQKRHRCYRLSVLKNRSRLRFRNNRSLSSTDSTNSRRNIKPLTSTFSSAESAESWPYSISSTVTTVAVTMITTNARPRWTRPPSRKPWKVSTRYCMTWRTSWSKRPPTKIVSRQQPSLSLRWSWNPAITRIKCLYHNLLMYLKKIVGHRNRVIRTSNLKIRKIGCSLISRKRRLLKYKNSWWNGNAHNVEPQES